MKIEISVGELVDKVSILEIKTEKIKDTEKLNHIAKEFKLLIKVMQSLGINLITDEYIRLKEVNLKLWNIEDEIRLEESNKNFGQNFIRLARSVYIENDRRSAIKREINIKYKSELIEEKEYPRYDV